MDNEIEFAEPENTTDDVGSVRDTDPDLLDLDDADRGDDFTPTDEEEEQAAPSATAPAAAAPAVPEGEQDPEADPDAPAGNKPRMIPHQRFNEVNENLKTERKLREQLEQEVERLRQQPGQGGQPPAAAPATPPAAAPEAFDYRAAERRYQSLFLDGDEEGAAEVREEINAALRSEAQQAATAAITQYQANQQQELQQKAAQSEAEQFQQSVTKVYAAHPQLAPESPNFDQALEQDVIDWSNVFVSRGMTRSDALQAAVQKLLPAAAPAAAPAPAKVKPAPGQLTQEQIQRNLERAGQQPPLPTEGTGQRRVVDISKLTDDEFEALPEADRRRARGDSL